MTGKVSMKPSQESQEAIEETGERLFLAEEYVGLGWYMEVDTGKQICLLCAQELPAGDNGRSVGYRYLGSPWNKRILPALSAGLWARQRQFDALYAQSRSGVYHLAYRALYNWHDAEDITQETFARAWANFEHL